MNSLSTNCDRHNVVSTSALAQTIANWIIGIRNITQVTRNITQDAIPTACHHAVKFVRMHHTTPS
jgi:hypothetical protein